MNQKRRGASVLTPLADREFPIRGHYIVCIVRYASFFFQSRFLHEADAGSARPHGDGDGAGAPLPCHHAGQRITVWSARHMQAQQELLPV